jgi:hypothetical protein
VIVANKEEMWSILSGAWWTQQSARWNAEKRDWQKALLSCPIAKTIGGGEGGDNDDGDDDGGGGGGGSGGGGAGGSVTTCGERARERERERTLALKARIAVACIATTFAIYVFIDQLITHGGTPYYFIWLTNWTGALTSAYTILVGGCTAVEYTAVYSCRIQLTHSA